MFVALLPVNLVFVLLISSESLMKKEYLISAPSVLLKHLVWFYRTRNKSSSLFLMETEAIG